MVVLSADGHRSKLFFVPRKLLGSYRDSLRSFVLLFRDEPSVYAPRQRLDQNKAEVLPDGFQSSLGAMHRDLGFLDRLH